MMVPTDQRGGDQEAGETRRVRSVDIVVILVRIGRAAASVAATIGRPRQERVWMRRTGSSRFLDRAPG